MDETEHSESASHSDRPNDRLQSAAERYSLLRGFHYGFPQAADVKAEIDNLHEVLWDSHDGGVWLCTNVPPGHVLTSVWAEACAAGASGIISLADVPMTASILSHREA